MTAFADNFLAGSLLSLLMPTLLLTAIAVWFVFAVRRIPKDTPESASTLPPPEMVTAAGADVHELTPTDPAPGQTAPGGKTPPSGPG